MGSRKGSIYNTDKSLIYFKGLTGKLNVLGKKNKIPQAASCHF